jgi:lipopolysaccharide biosynthesis protein
MQSRVLAFYLPQFHAIPENDAWWGKGFTDWTNVRRATPAFVGHDQPRRAGELGYYDLTDIEVLRAQAELGAEYGIDGFCFYYYWFDGQRLLETPLDRLVNSDVEMPFCLSWANENWTRRWDGKDHEVLAHQTYQRDAPERLARDLVRYINDRRYIELGGNPVLLIHRIDHIPNPRDFTKALRSECELLTGRSLHLIAAESSWNIDPRRYGADAIAEFPPLGSNIVQTAHLRRLAGMRNDFSGRVQSYDKLVRRHIQRRNPTDFIRYAGVTPGWDNTPRRGEHATVYVGHNPEKFRSWLLAALERENGRTGRTGLVFVNAWNEWAEGAYLEPDQTLGRSNLEAVRTARTGGEQGARSLVVESEVTTVRPAAFAGWRPYARSLAFSLASSAKNYARAIRLKLARQ